jgi:putative transposase
VSAHQAQYRVATMCRVLEVSTSGYYAWRKRPASRRAQEDAVLLRRIRTIHEASRQSYGVPRVYRELREDGVEVGRDRVARLMRQAGLRGISRRRFVVTTRRDATAQSAPDLVERRFEAEGPNQLWLADITYLPTWAGFLYLAIVLDVFSRRVVGWAMKGHLRTELVLEALQMAVSQRRPRGVIHHSDRGSQYTSIAFSERCDLLGVRPSMGSVGDAYDNAMAESFFATLECELLDRTRFQTQREAYLAVFEWIEAWYNPHRRHSSIGYLSPIEFERHHAAAGELGGSAPEPPWTCERGRGQEGPGFESAKLSTEPR